MTYSSRLHFIALSIVCILYSNLALTNNITSQLRGVVDDANCPCELILTNSQQQLKLQKNVNGQQVFSFNNLAAGQEYQLTVRNQQHVIFEESFTLELNQDKWLTIAPSNKKEVIQVVGRQTTNPNQFNAQQLHNLSVFNRDIKQALNQSAYVIKQLGADAPLSIAGQHPNMNQFSVDGLAQNDNFGLNSNGYPTQRLPIPFAALANVSVSPAPFDVHFNNFTGGDINVTTKSGAEDFSAGVFYQYGNEQLSGKLIKDNGSKAELDDFAHTFFGFDFSGSLSEQLYYFVAFEAFNSPKTATWAPTGAYGANNADITLEDVQKIQQIALNTYQIDIGDWHSQPQEQDEKWLIKLDWFANQQHKLSTTLQYNEGNLTRNSGWSASDLYLSSHWYDKIETLKSATSYWHADWSDNLSSEFKLAYKDVTTEQKSLSDFADVTVYSQINNNRPTAAVSFGSDIYRHANQLSNQTFISQFSFDYQWFEHSLLAGIEWQQQQTKNLFAPNSKGSWQFNSIEHFANQQASKFSYANAYTNNPADAAVDIKLDTLSLFLADNLQINQALNVELGLRYQKMYMANAPKLNQKFVQRFGFNNNHTLDGLDVLLPRVQLIWQINPQHKLSLGAGYFSGGQPLVWLANNFSNDGITYTQFDPASVDSEIYLTDVNLQVPNQVKASLQQADGYTNSLSPNFKLPYSVKSSATYQYTPQNTWLGANWQHQLEFLYQQNRHDVIWQELIRTPQTNTDGSVKTTQDGGRILYQTLDPLTGEHTSRYDIVLTNSVQNTHSQIWSLSSQANWMDKIKLSIQYANQNIDEIQPGYGSTAGYNYTTAATINRNNPSVGTSTYQVKHKFAVNLTYQFNWLKHYASELSLQFERRSGTPYSWTLESYYSTDFGDQNDLSYYSSYLAYIPTKNDANVVYQDLNYAELAEYMQQFNLEQYAGGYTAKNQHFAPWQSYLDLNFRQQLPAFSSNHLAEVYLTIKNLLNFFNSDWGKIKNRGDSDRPLVAFNVDEQGRYVYRKPYYGFSDNSWFYADLNASVWQMQIGLSYRF
ncbi:OmpA family Oar-like outer membrane protein [Catenovulum agarivorans DS-2]|uniref:OmpA family Oar-like outer membrane protein n=1 Tax=Catenovulum agarivorans DS-2 TaxID=1328313 RepID=W7Q7G8_9ALTE|nr:TonB-dependent receptor [Catenovulum agarivorans]EWH08719.1 OmpA family Oar-like outer membrane protein [Catenovulum agarivorans DS-2]